MSGATDAVAVDPIPSPAEVMAEPLRALLSPGVLQHPYASAGWQVWLTRTLAARARKVRWRDGSGLDCVGELAAILETDPEWRPIAPDHQWDHPQRLVDAMLGAWHFSSRIAEFNAAARSLAGRDTDVPADWWERDPSFGCFKALLRAARANTTRWLSEHGITEAWLWRGENLPADAPWTPDPLTFWSPVCMYAHHFARWDRVGRVAGGRLILARVPAERIASVGGRGIGQPHMGEVLVDGLGGPLSGWCWSIPGPEIQLGEPDDGELERWLLGDFDPTWRGLAERFHTQGVRPFRPLG